MEKNKVLSLQIKNANDYKYMIVHNRMYALSSSDSFRIYLSNCKDVEVFVDVVKDVFDSFVKYELSFGTMFLIYTTLCVKYGSIKLPF